MMMFMLFATICLVLLPANLSILVPYASAADWMSQKVTDRPKARLTLLTKYASELNETFPRSTHDYMPNLNSKKSDDDRIDNEAPVHVSLLYFIVLSPFNDGNVSKGQKSSNYDVGKTFGSARDKDNYYEYVVEGVVSNENKEIPNKEANDSRPYFMFVSNHDKSLTNKIPYKKKHSGIAKEKSELAVDFRVNEDKNSKGNHKETIEFNGNRSDLLKLNWKFNKQNLTSNNGIKKNNKAAIHASMFAKPFNSGRKNDEFSKNSKIQLEAVSLNNRYTSDSNGISREAFRPTEKGQPDAKKQDKNNYKNYFGESPEVMTTKNTDDLSVKGNSKNFKEKHLETVESNQKHVDIFELYKKYRKIFQLNSKQNPKSSNESKKNNETAIYMSRFSKSFSGDEKNDEFNKKSEVPFKISGVLLNNGYTFDSNAMSGEAYLSTRKDREGVQPDEKKHENYYKYVLPYFGEYIQGMDRTTQNTYGLKYKASGETERENGRFQINDSTKSPSRIQWIGEGHDKGTHLAYFKISNHAEKQTSLSRQKRHKESEEREQGNANVKKDTIRAEKPLMNDSNSGSTTAEKPFHKNSTTSSESVKKLPNSSPDTVEILTDDKAKKNSEGNGTSIAMRNNRHKRNDTVAETSSNNSKDDFSQRKTSNDSSEGDVSSKPNISDYRKWSNLHIRKDKHESSNKEVKSTNREKMREQTENMPRTSSFQNTPNNYLNTGSIKNTSAVATQFPPHPMISEKANSSLTVVISKNAFPKRDSVDINGSSGDTLIINKTLLNNTSVNAFRKERSIGKFLLLRTYLKEDKTTEKQTEMLTEDCTDVQEMTTPGDIYHTTAEERREEEATYRKNGSNNVNTTLPEVRPQHATTELTRAVNDNITTQEPTVTEKMDHAFNHTEIVKSEETTHHEKFNGEIEMVTKKTEMLNENITVQLHHIVSTPEIKNGGAAVYRKNIDHKLIEMVTDETYVVNRSNTGVTQNSNLASLNDNVERNSSGSDLMKETIPNVMPTEHSKTIAERKTQPETNSGPTDDPPLVERQNTNHMTNPRPLLLPEQLIRTKGNNAETESSNQGLLNNDKRNATDGNLNETDDTEINPQQHMVTEQMHTFTDNSTFETFIFARNNSFVTTKEVTTQSSTDNQHENTTLQQTKALNKSNIDGIYTAKQTIQMNAGDKSLGIERENSGINRFKGIPNMATINGWAEKIQINGAKEKSEMETDHPSVRDDTEKPLNENKSTVFYNSKDAPSFKNQHRITTAHLKNIPPNSETNADVTALVNSDDDLATQSNIFDLDHGKETSR